MRTAAVCRHLNRYTSECQSAPPFRSPRKKPTRDQSPSVAGNGLQKGLRGIAPKGVGHTGSPSTRTRCSGLAGAPFDTCNPTRVRRPLSRRYKNTCEPASCLVGWEARLRKIDAKYEKGSSLPAVNPFKIVHAAREAAAKRKSDELTRKRERLKELQQRRSAATSVDEPDKADEETIAPDHVDEETTREHLTEAAELLARQLQRQSNACFLWWA